MSASSDGRLFDPGGLGHDDDVCLTLEDDQLSDMMMMKSIMKIKERNCDFMKDEVFLSEMKNVIDKHESVSDSCNFYFNLKMSDNDNHDTGAGAGIVQEPPSIRDEQQVVNENENGMDVDMSQVAAAQMNDGDGNVPTEERISQRQATEVNGTGARPREQVGTRQDGDDRQADEHDCRTTRSNCYCV